MSSLEQRLRAEQLKLSLGNIINSAMPPPIAAILVAWFLFNNENGAALSTWCVATVLFSLFQVYDARRRLAEGIDPNETMMHTRYLILSSAIIGICWAALPWVVFDPNDVAGSVLIVAVIVGVAANMMATLAPVLPAFVAFIVFQTTGLASKLFMQDDTAYLILSAGGPIFMTSLIGIARNSCQTVRAAILLQFENSELVNQLKVEKAHAEQANQAKTKFLAAASHDLRQPIHAQGLFMEALGRSELSESQQELLQQIRETWSASADMLDTLLDYSRIEAGIVEPQVRPFHLQSLLNKLEKELGPQADQKQIVYRTRETAVAVESDPALVELILRNLIFNAIRYTEKGGVLIGCRQCGQHVTVEIWDTGIGMTLEQQQNIFQEFHQVGNSERDRRKGLGLGLSIADGLAHILALPLTLSSQPGKGTVFRLTLPLADSPVINDRIERLPIQIRPLELKILIIDDEQAVRDGMLQLLRSWGCECEVAESLQQAQSIVDSFQPALLISDYRLRESQTGADVIEQLRSKLGQNLPAILVTGDTAPERIREATESGIPLLHKPIAASMLYQRIAALVSST